MKKKGIGYIFGISLLSLFVIAISEPEVTGMAIGVKDYSLNLYTLLIFVFASFTVISGIAYHREIDIIDSIRDKNLKKLDEYVTYCLSQRRNEFSIKQELLAYGWSEEYINDSFHFIKHGKNIIDFYNYSRYINKK